SLSLSSQCRNYLSHVPSPLQLHPPSLHDALPICDATDNKNSLDDVMRALYTRFYQKHKGFGTADLLGLLREFGMPNSRNSPSRSDRKSTRLNSSHQIISYAVFCLKKKKKTIQQ